MGNSGITVSIWANQKLARKTYTFPIIGKTIKHLEGLKYATALYINMGYYTKSFLPTSPDMMAIVTEFGKFRYNCLHMGMCDLRTIIQTEVDKLLGVIEGVKTYLGDI